MRNQNRSATTFVVLVWTALLLLVSHHLYSNIMDAGKSGAFDFKPKSVEEMLNGNP